MDKNTLKLGILRRSMQFERGEGAIDDEKRTVRLSFSSETPVSRYFGNEVLGHGDGEVDLSRLNSGGPFLVDHDTGDHVGVIEKAELAGKRGEATVRLGNSARANEIFQDIKDGIRSLVSVGYRINKLQMVSRENGVETYRATSWTPLEISLVSVPADPSVGVGRGADHDTTEVTIERSQLMDDPKDPTKPTPTPAPASVEVVNQAKTEARKEELKRQNEIRKQGDLLRGKGYDLTQIVDKALEDGVSIEEFKHQAFEAITGDRAKPVLTSPNIGMDEKELKNYSLARTIKLAADNKGVLPNCLEKEASDATVKLSGRALQGSFMIPHDVMAHKRDMTAGIATAGGNTIQTDVLGGSLIELLRNKQLVNTLGARNLDGLQGNVAIPRQSGGASAFWLAETGTATESDQTIDQLALTPHRLAAFTDYSKQLLAQSTIDVEAFCREDLMLVLAIARDLAAIAGTGAGNQPTGILNTTGIGSVTFGVAGAPTWAEMVSFETKVANANADIGRLAYLTTPNVRGNLKTSAKIGTTYPVFMWEGADSNGMGTVNGYPAAATKQVPSDKVLFGNWNDVIQASWIGLDVTVDPFSRALQGEIRIILQMYVDVGLRHAGSFTASSNNAA